MSRERPFETVHTMVDWDDGPREGIADCDGEPHLYQSHWDEELQDFDPAYVLTPIPDDVFQIARILTDRLVEGPANSFRALGEFESMRNAERRRRRFPPLGFELSVRWEPVDVDA